MEAIADLDCAHASIQPGRGGFGKVFLPAITARDASRRYHLSPLAPREGLEVREPPDLLTRLAPLHLVRTRSTASLTLPGTNGTRWNASLPTPEPGSGKGVCDLSLVSLPAKPEGCLMDSSSVKNGIMRL